jgi:tRNA (cytidine/uridine-2'-O-)-methyltransferase
MKTELDATDRLRCPPPATPFHVVLVEPEIPPNTGNVARLCAATCSHLHLVGKLGFRVDEHAVRRAGLDYWHLVPVEQHAELAGAEARVLERTPGATIWFLSGHGGRSYLDADFAPGDAFVFGKESVGLDPALLEDRKATVLGIPTLGGVRSHNLANAVAIVLYEALRKTGQLAAPTLAP